MTNKEKLLSLNGLEFAEAMYEITKKIGWRYTISTKGTAEWLDQPYDLSFWEPEEFVRQWNANLTED